MTPTALLAAAREVAGQPGLPVGLSLRASALLGRQALEHAMAEVLSRHGVACRRVPFATQLVCLAGVVGDPKVGAEAAFVWDALSGVCHYQFDEVPPDPVEVRNWLGMVERVLEAVA